MKSILYFPPFAFPAPSFPDCSFFTAVPFAPDTPVLPFPFCLLSCFGGFVCFIAYSYCNMLQNSKRRIQIFPFPNFHQINYEKQLCQALMRQYQLVMFIRNKRQQQIKSPLSPMSPDLFDAFPSFTDPKASDMKNSANFGQNDNDLLLSNMPVVSKVKPIPQNILKIVSKQVDDRTTSQNAIRTKYLLRLNFFRQLVDLFSLQVVKQMLRDGKLKLYGEGDILAHMGRKKKYIRILLNGQAGVVEKEEGAESDDTENSVWQILTKLVEKLAKETKYFKLKGTVQNKSILNELVQNIFGLKSQKSKKNKKFQTIETIYPQTILNYSQLLSYQPKHHQTLVATANNTLVFVMSIEDFYQSLLMHYHQKQNQVIKLFRKIPFFNSFQNSKLKILISKLHAFDVKKGQFIYKAGDKAENFYLLIEGQVEITKKIGIFKENPNNLYKNRSKMSKEKFDLEIKTLPYADFDGVYNYQQQQTLITLAIINPISIFGEEELIEKQDRQVNAKVLSLNAKMYKISLADIEQFCSKVTSSQSEKKMTLLQFFNLVEESVTMKKILFRQNQLSQMVEHQNKARYESLFQEPDKKRSFSKKSANFSTRTMTAGISQRRANFEEQVPPTFNNFNFTQFMSTSQQNFEQAPSKVFSKEEAKVMKYTHTKYHDSQNKKKEKDKVIRLRNFSGSKISKEKASIDVMATVDSITGISSVKTKEKDVKKSRSQPKQSITLDEPLFTVKYFKNQAQKERKLVTVAKKKQLETIYKNTEDLHRLH